MRERTPGFYVLFSRADADGQRDSLDSENKVVIEAQEERE
jgi:hypothetical protein